MDGASSVKRELTEVEGIGPTRAAQLAEQGIETVEDLAAADADSVARGIPGVSVWMAAEWVQGARMVSPREEATSPAAEGRERAVGVGQPGKSKVAGRGAEEVLGTEGMDPLRHLYEKGTWRGKEQWRCRVCPFDTLKGEEVIREHVARKHVLESWEARAAKAGIVVAKR